MFEQVVFAGGGNRCWWQAGLWDIAAPALGLKPRVIAGASAGAATACMLYANDSEHVLRYYAHALAGNRKNFYASRLLRGERPFPHGPIYRQALLDILGGPHFERLRRTAPEIRVQFARIPPWLGPRSAVAVGLVAYNIEKYARKSLHPTFGRRLGFTPDVRRVQDCATPEALASLLIASSCTPPITPIELIDGRPTIDGGLVDNVPVDAVDANGGPTLVLVTRRYPRYPEVWRIGGLTYVQPSRKVPTSSWDYTNPAAMRHTWEQGRQDAHTLLRALEAPDAIARFDSRR